MITLPRSVWFWVFLTMAGVSLGYFRDVELCVLFMVMMQAEYIRAHVLDVEHRTILLLREVNHALVHICPDRAEAIGKAIHAFEKTIASRQAPVPHDDGMPRAGTASNKADKQI